MTNEFNSAKFLSWLENQESSVKQETIHEQWPDFPYENIPVGITVGVSKDGEPLYYKRDLRRAAQGKANLD